MKKRKLGNTGIMLPELCYGCTAQFGKNIFGKEGIREEQAFSLVKAALESGITFFDTGFNYGSAEERLGRCLSDILKDGTIKREDIIIQTKGCEILNNDGTYGSRCYSAEWIKRSIEISLERLKLDYLDLFALHGAKPEVLSDELFNLLSDLKSQGTIRAYGVSGVNDTFGYWICKEKCFDYIMMTYNYAEARRNPLIEELSKEGIGIITGASLNRSLNTIKHHPKTKEELWYLIRAFKNFRKDMKRSKLFDFVKDVEGMTPQQVSLAYILENPNISSASFNTLNVDHLKSNAKAVEMTLPKQIKQKIESIH